jgi:hypothetical protein
MFSIMAVSVYISLHTKFPFLFIFANARCSHILFVFFGWSYLKKCETITSDAKTFIYYLVYCLPSF